jgi:hypothetical protein
MRCSTARKDFCNLLYRYIMTSSKAVREKRATSGTSLLYSMKNVTSVARKKLVIVFI